MPTKKLPRKKATFTESTGHEKIPRLGVYDQQANYKLYGYKDTQIPPKMRVPYVLTRYRFPGLSAEQCVSSLFQPHNELVNIWTHLMSLTMFLLQVMSLIKTVNIMEEPLVVPLLCCILGICIMFLVSAGTHLFNSLSPYMYHICYFLDYAAISISCFTISQGVYFYSRPLSTTFRFFNMPELFLSLNLLNSLICTFMCCSVLVKRPWYHILVRSSAYTSLCLFTISPYIGRLVLCTLIKHANCPVGSFVDFKQCGIYIAVGALIYATRTPERFAPKMFDLLGQSHNIFHVLSALGTSHLFTALHTDMIERKKELLADPLAFVEVSVIFTVLAVVLNALMVGWFSRSLYLRQSRTKLD